MSHSQFHSTKLFILRHAWLNLWDKHMTTGRINQVTTIHLLWIQSITTATNGTKGHFHRWEFIKLVEELAAARPYLHSNEGEAAANTPCSPISQISSTFLRVTYTATKIMAFIGNYLQLSQQTLSTAVIVDSQVVNCNRFGHQQATHILHSLQASKRYSTCKGRQGSEDWLHNPIAWLSYPKSVQSVKTDTSITRIKKSQSSL